jgi:glycosyltransferase involved in cell wall biosynthesis
MNLPELSIIVPSYNSRRTIMRCLQSLHRQEAEFSYEIIVVDSSDDGTGDLVKSQYPGIKLIRMPERTLAGAARNVGIEAAQGRILAFTDADCEVETGWGKKILQAHQDESCAAVGGAVLNALPLNPVAWSCYLLEFSEQLPSSPKRFVSLLATCNISFKRYVFQRHGSFPSHLSASEDMVFAWRLASAGERLLFDPTIRIHHIFRPDFHSFIRHQLWLGEWSARARTSIDLPHAWAAEHPLRWLVPVVRLARIQGRLIRRDPVKFLLFNLLLPVCLSGLAAWGIGFCQKSRLERRDLDSKLVSSRSE